MTDSQDLDPHFLTAAGVRCHSCFADLFSIESQNTVKTQINRMIDDFYPSVRDPDHSDTNPETPMGNWPDLNDVLKNFAAAKAG